MHTPYNPNEYTVTIRRVICIEAHIKITAPHADAALLAAEQPNDLMPRFLTIWKRVHYSVKPKKRGSKL